jgi:hypothetical protein
MASQKNEVTSLQTKVKSQIDPALGNVRKSTGFLTRGRSTTTGILGCLLG